MKNTKILLALLLLAALTLCSCHNPSPDPAEITPPPAETTPAETTPPSISQPHGNDFAFVGSAEEVVDRIMERDMSLSIYSHDSAIAVTSANDTEEFLKVIGCDISAYDEEFFKSGFLLLTAVNSEQKSQTTVKVGDTDDKNISINVSVSIPEASEDTLYAGHYEIQFDIHPISVPYSEQKVTFSYEHVIASADSDEVAIRSPELSTYSGFITSPDSISLKGIKVDVYEVTGPKYGMDPSPYIIAYQKYDTNYDFSDYELSYIYRFSVYTDPEGKFNFEIPSSGTYIMFDFDTLPSQYGIRGGNIDLREPYSVVGLAENEFVLEKAVTATIACRKSYDGFHFMPELYSVDNKLLYGKAFLSHGRFSDGFVDAMINGSEIDYSATVKCGELYVEASTRLPLGYYYSAWEWRVDYLYYNNYIDTVQYEEIYRTKEPTQFGPYY